MNKKEMKMKISEDSRIAANQAKACLKLMEMAKKAGKKEKLKEILEQFKFELKNNIVSYHTLEKLKELEKEFGTL